MTPREWNYWLQGIITGATAGICLCVWLFWLLSKTP